MLSIKKKGLPVAEILGGPNDKKIISLIIPNRKKCCGLCNIRCKEKKKKEDRCCDKCIPKCHDTNDEKEDSTDCFDEYICKDGEELEIVPNIKEREISYIAGPSGSGKSTISAKYMKKFKDIFNDKDVFVFSRLDKDPVIDKLKPFRIQVDEKLLSAPIDIQRELKKGAILLFDDVGTIQNPFLKKYIENLMADIMEVGRKLNIWIIITNHLVIPNERKFARCVMNEMHTFTFFPKSGTVQQITYALKTYFGLSDKQIKKILNLPSQFVTVSRSYPQYVLYEKGIYIL